ncbi:hypothetical protein NX773_11380 [Massilia solisilvae]|uniref:Uncharacterized protein n=1 Tax=Massilia solisilvae TaxID=1811225 RepID=A0ABT2BJX3_9BURK|nr:hypothetical protein [Massilia solisilvae]MCS0608767.1 hypothetical protein [Massilia solisilvae]
MATISYGKGKNLQPTSSKALKAALDESTRNGKVEMPDIKQGNKTPNAVTDLGADKGPRIWYVKQMQLRQGVVAQLNQKPAAYRVRKLSAAAKGMQKVRVTIDAPDVLEFFSVKKTKSHSF